MLRSMGHKQLDMNEHQLEGGPCTKVESAEVEARHAERGGGEDEENSLENGGFPAAFPRLVSASPPGPSAFPPHPLPLSDHTLASDPLSAFSG